MRLPPRGRSPSASRGERSGETGARRTATARGDRPRRIWGPIEAFDGTALAVRAAGPPDGPIVLFSHGFSLDMTTWREQWSDLGDEFRCIALDHRAHGRSEVPGTGDVSLRSMGRDLATVLDAVAPDRRVVVIGHSMGAMAILALAEQRPDLFGPRIGGVAFLGTSASDLLRGAMGGVTHLLRPRLGSVARPLAAWTASAGRSSPVRRRCRPSSRA